jgi:hypothetical protein
MSRPPNISDEDLALEFLAGKIEQSPKGQISHTFHDPGSDGESAARAALLRLLRSRQPLSEMIRWRLAALLDPAHSLEERKFTIENRQAGQQPHHVIALEIARYIAAEAATGRQIESAKEAAKDRYAVSLSTVERAWREHKNSKLVGSIWHAGRTVN